MVDPAEGLPQPAAEAGYDPARDADHEMHDQLYCEWSCTHDYDPRWDYGDELRPHWQTDPLIVLGQQHLHRISGGVGRVFAADLSDRDIVGVYIFGTASEPVMLIDPAAHEHHTDDAQEARQQLLHTVSHEYRHSQQELENDGQPIFDEDDAEQWRAPENP